MIVLPDKSAIAASSSTATAESKITQCDVIVVLFLAILPLFGAYSNDMDGINAYLYVYVYTPIRNGGHNSS